MHPPLTHTHADFPQQRILVSAEGLPLYADNQARYTYGRTVREFVVNSVL